MGNLNMMMHFFGIWDHLRGLAGVVEITFWITRRQAGLRGQRRVSEGKTAVTQCVCIHHTSVCERTSLRSEPQLKPFFFHCEDIFSTDSSQDVWGLWLLVFRFRIRMRFRLGLLNVGQNWDDHYLKWLLIHTHLFTSWLVWLLVVVLGQTPWNQSVSHCWTGLIFLLTKGSFSVITSQNESVIENLNVAQ